MDMSKLKDLVQSRREQIEARKTQGTKTAKIPAGTSRWRILPGWREGEEQVYYHDFGQHWFKNADGTLVAVAVCDYATFGKECALDAPISAAIKATKDDKTIERLKELQAKKCVLVNAVCISGPEADPNKAQLLPLPVGVADSFHNFLHQRLADDINMLDPVEGRDIIIEKTGSGLNTRYTVTDAAKSTPVSAAALASRINIDAYIAAERTRGQVKAVEGLNTAMAAALKVAPSSTSSLIGVGAAPAAAIAAPAVAVAAPVVATPAVAAAADVLAETAPAPVAAPARPGVAVATPAFSGDTLDDDELNALLASIDAKG